MIQLSLDPKAALLQPDTINALTSGIAQIVMAFEHHDCYRTDAAVRGGGGSKVIHLPWRYLADR